MGNHIRQRYCWIIVLLVSLEMAVFGGLVNSLNVFLIPICEDLNISRGSYAATDAPYHLSSAVTTMFSVLMYRKIGYKKTAAISLLFVVASLALLSISNSLLEIGFCRVLLGVGYGLALTAGSVWIINNWFIQHRGVVIGLVSMFTGLGGSLMTVVSTALIQRFGWRITNLILAGVIILVILSYLFFLQDSPEKVGLQPLQGHTLKAKNKPIHTQWMGLPFRDWKRKPLFCLMILFTTVFSISIYTVYFVIVPHFQDQGFSPERAAVYQSGCMLALAAAKLLCGGLSDKFGAKAVSAVCIACGVAGQGILSATAEPVLGYVGVFMIAAGLCMTTVMIPLLSPAIFGYFSADSITSILLAIISLSSIPAKLIANIGFDRYGSYTPSFWLSTVANTGMVAVYILILILSGREQKKS